MKTQVEQYIEMRNKNRYDTSWFYTYYVENSKHNISFQDFNRIFGMSDFNSILQHLDRKFGLDVLTNKEGSFIKCYSSPTPQD